MTRLGYLLPFLWTLGYSTTLTTNPTTITTDKPVGNVYTTTQSITSVNTVDSTVSHSNPSVASSTDATSAKITTSTANLPSVSPETNKLTTISDQQRTTQPTTAKPDIKPVEVTSTRKSSITDTTPTVIKPNDNATQPTDLTKGSTQVLISSPQAVTAPPSTMTKTTNLTTQLAATSPASLRTSQPSNVTDIRKTEVSSVSTVSLSPAIIYKTTRRNPDSTTSLVKNSTPMTTPPMIPKQKYIENIEFNCTAEHGESLVTIDVKSSSICGDYTSKDEDYVKKILQHICTALKPGYQPNKDRCHIDLGRRFPDGLAILDAYVHNSLPKKDLYAALKHIKKDQDGAYLFTYDGQKYEEEDLVSIPLISAIVALAVALLIAAAIYGCWHQRQTRKREQRLTEELQTMENGYHDNPTLEVMETSPEMQEKKGGPNGELGDSWIVPLDNLTREDFDDEEDTHL